MCVKFFIEFFILYSKRFVSSLKPREEVGAIYLTYKMYHDIHQLSAPLVISTKNGIALPLHIMAALTQFVEGVLRH